MYYSDHGEFFDGDIHDAKSGIHKWSFENSRGPITEGVSAPEAYTFTCVRNPYSRILSSFFDKICGIQRNGNYYRGNLVPMLIQKYGIDVGRPEDGFQFDQIKSFRRFLLFARDTIRWRQPMEPDIHWSAQSSHIGTFVSNGGRFDDIIWTEHFNTGMQRVVDSTLTTHKIDLTEVPRFNESEGHGPARAYPVEDYFDDLSMHLVYEIYKADFQLFRYDFENPKSKAPIGQIDLDEVHAKLS